MEGGIAVAVYLPNTGILETSGRVFGLDSQFLADAGIMAIAMLVLFTLLSYLLFNPVRDFLKKRQEFIESNINDALKDKEEAARIVQRANKEAELEKSKVKDEIKKEMITVAREMAGKLVEVSIDDAKQDSLIDETLKEMGDSTWQS